MISDFRSQWRPLTTLEPNSLLLDIPCSLGALLPLQSRNLFGGEEPSTFASWPITSVSMS